MSKVFLPKLQDNLYWVLNIYFCHRLHKCWMKTVSKACTQGYLPEVGISFRASRMESQHTKETNLHLPFPLLRVRFLPSCLFWRTIIWNVVIITVINNEGSIEWFIFHVWKFLSCCPSWRWSQHLPFTVHGSILDCFLLMNWQVCSALLDAWILSSPTELCRSAMLGSLTLSSSTRGNSLLP